VGSLDDRTIAEYARYFEKLLDPFFGTAERVTTEKARDYIAERLGEVQPATVTKELSALRSAVKWHYGDSAPAVPKVSKRATGTKYEKRRRGAPTELTSAEVRRILASMPERTRDDLPARAFFTALYETALRPAALCLLSVPENYRKGRKELTLGREQDKARWGRPLPLTPAARAALDSAAPAAGLIFGEHHWWRIFRAAVSKAKLPPEKAASVCPYDLRHARITHWVDDGASLTGVQYLSGHKLLATTTKYVRPSLRAAMRVVGKRGLRAQTKKRRRALKKLDS
jgi:integrase